MQSFSICIIAKNEEKNIHPFLTAILKHTKGYPVEIVIADTGSTDHTREIAESFPVKLFSFPWINDFSAARNFSIQQASNDWILVLDCDEFITSLDMDGLHHFMEHYPKSVGLLERHNHYPANGNDCIAADYVERFFNRRFFHYESIIHEQVCALDASPLHRISIPLTVNHIGYAGTLEELSQKVTRNNILLLKMLEDNPDDPYLYYQLGQGAYVLHDYGKACFYYGKGLEYDVEPKALYVQMMIEGYGYSLLETQQYEKALQFENIYDEFADSADFVFLMGYIYLRTGNYLQAMSEFEKAASFPDARMRGANSFLPYYNLGVINECLGNLDAAKAFYQKCGDFKQARERLKVL